MKELNELLLRYQMGQTLTPEEESRMRQLQSLYYPGSSQENTPQSGLSPEMMPGDVFGGQSYYTDNLAALSGESAFGVKAPFQAQVTRPGYNPGVSPLTMEGVEGTEVERGFRTSQSDPNAPFIVDDMFRSNDRMPNIFGTDRVVGTDSEGGDILSTDPTKKETPTRGNQFNPNILPFMYPGGSDINTQLYSAGRGIGMEKGAQGRNALIVGGLGAAALGTTRNLLAGIGYEKQQNYVRDWYRQRQRDVNYTPIEQTRDQNNLGGNAFRQGGEFYSYEEGGMMEQPISPEQQMSPEQGQEQQQVIQQIQMAVVDMLQQGVQPEQVMQELVQQGVPEEAAMQIIQDVMMQMQGQQQQGVPQEMMPEAPMQGLPQEAQQNPMMRLGGKKVGDPISFKYGGKMHKGKIKKIENGKIYI
jgi:hypothetical protein